ncbi:unnamed protein product [Moneuplotes crassus]|uniref:Uncharacterized protein n=1 Tax=Euplotes crassus TaxID=5936 RepID=A0AAD1XMW2_EUPCR|nr:unnamed protein product [Moneuplotes crassus]
MFSELFLSCLVGDFSFPEADSLQTVLNRRFLDGFDYSFKSVWSFIPIHGKLTVAKVKADVLQASRNTTEIHAILSMKLTASKDHPLCFCGTFHYLLQIFWLKLCLTEISFSRDQGEAFDQSWNNFGTIEAHNMAKVKTKIFNRFVDATKKNPLRVSRFSFLMPKIFTLCSSGTWALDFTKLSKVVRFSSCLISKSNFDLAMISLDSSNEVWSSSSFELASISLLSESFFSSSECSRASWRSVNLFSSSDTLPSFISSLSSRSLM